MKANKKRLGAIVAAMIVAASATTTAFAASQPTSVLDSAIRASASAITISDVVPQSYTVIAGAATGGTISPSGGVDVAAGSNQTFTITPSSGYAINEVIVDGSRKGAISSYTFSNVTSNHTIVASFRQSSQAAYTTDLLKTDTRSYTMAPGNVYGARITVEGTKFTQDNVRVYSSREHIASVTKVSNDVYQIRGLSAGTTYIVAEAGDSHASIRIDVKEGATAGGESCRSVSVIQGTPTTYPTTNNTPVVTTPTTPSTSGYIGEARAKQIAMNHAGVSNPNFIGVKMDYEHGVVVYDVEFYYGNKEYDYEINATTGAIMKFDYDIENYVIPGNTTTTTPSTPSTSGLISAERAKQIALSHAGVSASNAYAMEVGMDYEYGVQIYEIDFKSGYMEYEYDINAKTGAIMKAKRDYD